MKKASVRGSLVFYKRKEWDTYARQHVHTHFPYLRNGLTHCAKILVWFGTQLSTTMHFTQVMVGVRLHVRTCAPLFPMSGIHYGLEVGKSGLYSMAVTKLSKFSELG